MNGPENRVREALVLAATAGILIGAFVYSGKRGETQWNSRVDYARGSDLPAEVLEEGPNGRLVRHTLGSTRVPLRPRRIVSLVTSATDSLLALGLRPIAAESQWKGEGPIRPLAPMLADCISLGYGPGLNLEQVAALQPDLILCGRPNHARIYGKLSRIAPTVFLPVDLEDRHGALLEIGAILGLREEARRRLDLHRGRIEEARRRIRESAGDESVAVLRFRYRDCMIFGRGAKIGPLLHDALGLRPDRRVPERTRGLWADSIDVESLSEIRADRIFLLIDPDAAGMAQDVFDAATWKSIPAVQRGTVHRVDFGTWMNGQGVIATEAMAQEVLDAFAGPP